MPSNRLRRRKTRGLCLERLEERIALSLTIQFDYSYDSSGFFAANPAAKTVLQEAAQMLGGQISTALAAISPNPGAGNTWTANTFNPSNPDATLSVNNLNVPANTLIVYAGGTNFGGSEDGLGGPGGFSSTGSVAWNNLVAARGQAGALAAKPTGFGPWGGSVSFGTSTDWSFAGPGDSAAPGTERFLSVALHELGHVLGIGTAGSWTTYVDAANNVFTGPHAEAVYGGPVPLDHTVDTGPDADSHWDDNDRSDGVPPIMTPFIHGVTAFTPLDWAGLQDIGWTVNAKVNVDQLAVSYQPEAIATVGKSFVFSVAAEGLDGQVDTSFNGLVTLSIGANPVNGSLGGTVSATAVDGVASFYGVTLSKPGYGYTLVAKSAAIPSASATTNPIDVTPPNLPGLVPLDFNGAGKSELAVFRPSTDQWLIRDAGFNVLNTQYGDPAAGDVPAPGDYDGDGKTDLAAFRPSTDQWLIRFSGGGSATIQFGDPSAGDVPVPGDYEGNRKTDLAVYRPSTGQWIIRLTSGQVVVDQWGDPSLGDVPAPGDFDGDGKTDLAVFRPSTDQWLIRYSGGGSLITQFGDPLADDLPAPGNYDGDAKTDLAVFRPSTDQWLIRYSGGGGLNTQFGDPAAGDLAVNAPLASLGTITPLASSAPSSSPTAQLPATSEALAPWVDPELARNQKTQFHWLAAIDDLAGMSTSLS